MERAMVAVLIAVAVLFGITACADKHDHKPKYGGVVTEVDEIQYELVAKPDSIAIFVEDHGQKVDMKGGSATVTILSATDKTDMTLTPAGENKLEAKGAFKIASGSKAVASVTMPGKSAKTVPFTLP